MKPNFNNGFDALRFAITSYDGMDIPKVLSVKQVYRSHGSYVGWVKFSQITLRRERKIYVAHHFGKAGGHPQLNYSMSKVDPNG